MSNCLACTDPIPPCQGCKKTQECTQIARTCTQCPRNLCVDLESSKGSSGASTGTTAGAAVGGVVGVAVIIAVVWWFWWRPKGLEQSRKRYSKHLANRQSKVAEKRKTGQGLDAAANGAGGGQGDVAMKRSSVHLRMTDEGTHNRRSGVATGNLLDGTDETVPVSRTSDDDNPFGDQNRSSIGTFGINDDTASTHTSEFSFRSSHSTNIIPIAYIPPHSSSLSVDDAQGRSHLQRNASPSPQLPRRSSMNRVSIPTSMASRDSLALAGAEIIELNPLPPVLTPDTPSIPHGTMANGAPIRPPRSPGLDLQLPKTSSPLASPPINSPHLRLSRPPSGFPFVGNSSSTSPTSPTYPSHHQLLPPSTQGSGSRGMSVLGEPASHRAGSSQSHLSVMSSFTSRSNNSTMSYILDPPQIITPVNSQGVKRVEFQQAKAHKLGGTGGGSLSTTTNQSPTSPLATHDPFSDDASIENRSLGGAGGETGSSSRPVSTSSRWTTSSLSSEASEAVQFLQGQSITFTNPNTPMPLSAATTSGTIRGPSAQGGGGRGMSTLSVDLPRSARSSQSYSIAENEGGGNRQSTWSSTSESNGPSAQSMSRVSTTSSTNSHDSLLEGIPFMAPPMLTQLTGGPSSTSSVNLSLPINVTASSTTTRDLTSFPPPPARAPSPLPPTSVPLSASNSSFTAEGTEEEDPLPAPFLPFAGQRPTSSATSPTKSSNGSTNERVQSEHFSVRSGFGSGLSQIPFQLGFPSGFGDGQEEGDEDMGEGGGGERGSMLSSRGSGNERWSQGGREDEREEEDDDSGLSRVEERSEVETNSSVAQSRRESVKSISHGQNVLPTPPDSPPRRGGQDESNPFGSHAEVEQGGSDPRASMGTLALNAALSAELDGADM